MFVNIANYAYNPGIGTAVVRVSVTNNPITVEITFIDNGERYDPLAKPDPDTSPAALKRKKGGLGIFMVKKSMDDVRYEYKDGRNILTIIKKYEVPGLPGTGIWLSLLLHWQPCHCFCRRQGYGYSPAAVSLCRRSKEEW